MEEMYQYFWKHKMPLAEPRLLTDGKVLVVLDPGTSNTGAGPDFSNARLSIDGTLWAGNVEVHIKASDWFRHHHDSDPAYANIILHVVGKNDCSVFRPDGEVIEQYLMEIPEDFAATYNSLNDTDMDDIRCARLLGEIPEIIVTDWLESLAVRRLERKAERVLASLANCKGDWRQTLFVSLASGLGFGLNSLPFELLATSLPLNFAGRHADHPFQLQALLFGQAGMLDGSRHPDNDFYHRLITEYNFLRHKYSLRPIEGAMWKFSRTRPQNLPYRRVALLAEALRNGFPLYSQLMSLKDTSLENLREILSWKLDDYWTSHYSFANSHVGAPLPGALSRPSQDLLIINTIAPFLYAYGLSHSDYKYTDTSLALLETMKAESNAIIRKWRGLGVDSDTALRSQAVIELQREYCEKHRCLDCRFGNHLLRCSTGFLPFSRRIADPAIFSL